jgi:hypothetical protein
MNSTWEEIYGNAKALIPVGTAGTFETQRQALIFASEYQHKLQKVTGACKREYSFLTSGLDSEGRIALDTEVGTPEIIEYVATGSTRAGAVECIIYPYDQFRRLVRSTTWNTGVSTLIAVTTYNKKIHIWPQTGLNGTIYIIHRHKLSKYSIAAGSLGTGYWAGYEAALEAKMSAEGPEPEFDAASEGFDKYTAANLMALRPAIKQMYWREYNDMLREAESLLNEVVRDDVPNSGNLQSIINNGPVK